jgi:hypothetical protein
VPDGRVAGHLGSLWSDQAIFRSQSLSPLKELAL